MAEKSTIARPYAQAAFELANEGNALKAWSEMLELFAAVMDDAQMQTLIGNPKIEKQVLVDLILHVCEGHLTKAGENFIRVLADNKRLNILAEIATLYEQHRAEAERTIEAEIISAFPLSDAQQNDLVGALKKRLGREINLVTYIDESLIGGAIVRAGDLVIDGSVTGQLEKLASALTG